MADFNKDETLFLKAMSMVIRKLRVEKEYMNQETFANDHRYGRSRYQAIENGTNLTTVSILRLLSHHDNISMSKFMIMVEEQYEKLKLQNASSKNLKVINP
jgi:hypothetical protein